MSNLFKILISFGTLLAIGCGGGGGNQRAASPAPAPIPGSFTATGDLTTARTEHTATLLASGRVLLAGGTVLEGSNAPTTSTETYDPATGAFTSAATMGTPRSGHTATLLRDGHVLIAGGRGGAALAGAERYDPASGAFSAVGAMTTPRIRHAAVLLTAGADAGKVLIIGGEDASGTPLASLEIFDPAAGTFSLCPSAMAAGRARHTATVLEDGRVVIAGGQDSAQVEIYAPATRTLAVAGSMLQARSAHTATLLTGNRVLLAGGFAGGALAGNEVCDLSRSAPTFTAALAMAVPRRDHSATLLQSGGVLITGGSPRSDGTGGTAQAELFDPGRLTFLPAGRTREDFRFGTATLLPGGRVLVAGGWEFILEPSNYADLYQEGAGAQN